MGGYEVNIDTRINKERTPLQDVIPLNTPFVIFIDPCDTCNFKCRFCPTGDKLKMRGVKGRNHGPMNLQIYEKIINGLQDFDNQVKVIRLYKDGEPLLNKHFPEMVKMAKNSDKVVQVDTTTNGALLNYTFSENIIKSGIDRINISIEGLCDNDYKFFSRANVNFRLLVDNIRYLHNISGDCYIFIKINEDIISNINRNKFFDIFGPISDGIGGEHVMECWPHFKADGVIANNDIGIYGQPLTNVSVCPYIFYSYSINSNGTVSACFLDWSRELIVGDVSKDSLKDIWNSQEMNVLRKSFLKGNRNKHPFCKNCGQLTHGMPDNIDNYSKEILKRL